MSADAVVTDRIPAGWYTDPVDPARRRWWDGVQWTEHTHVETIVVDPVAASAVTEQAWWLATSPMWSLFLIVPAMFAFPESDRMAFTGALAIALLIMFVLTITLAISDRRILAHTGYPRAASALWSFLSPLAYLIARTVQVRQQVDVGFAPLLAWIGCAVASPIVALVCAFAAWGTGVGTL